MTIIKRPQGGATAGGPFVEGNKRTFHSPKVKSPVRNVASKGGKKSTKGSY